MPATGTANAVRPWSSPSASWPCLALIAIVVISIVIAEKRTSSSEYANNRAFYSADAASEAGVHWLRSRRSPPALVDTLARPGPDGVHHPGDDHRYQFDVTTSASGSGRAGASNTRTTSTGVEATGRSAQQSNAAVDFNATRLYREGY